MTLHCKVFICSEHIRAMVQVLDDKLTPQHFSALLLGIFAGVALLLAAVGMYSVAPGLRGS